MQKFTQKYTIICLLEDVEEGYSFSSSDWQQFAQTENFVHVAEKIESTLAPNSQDYFKFLTNNKAADISVIAAEPIPLSVTSYLANKAHKRMTESALNTQRYSEESESRNGDSS